MRVSVLRWIQNTTNRHLLNSAHWQRLRNDRTLHSWTQPIHIMHSQLPRTRTAKVIEGRSKHGDPGVWAPIQDQSKKGSPYSITSVGFRRWSQFLAVSLQVTRVINPAVGCHYFPPGLQLPSQPFRGLLPILLLGEQRHNGCEQSA